MAGSSSIWSRTCVGAVGTWLLGGLRRSVRCWSAGGVCKDWFGASAGRSKGSPAMWLAGRFRHGFRSAAAVFWVRIVSRVGGHFAAMAASVLDCGHFGRFYWRIWLVLGFLGLWISAASGDGFAESCQSACSRTGVVLGKSLGGSDGLVRRTVGDGQCADVAVFCSQVGG